MLNLKKVESKNEHHPLKNKLYIPLSEGAHLVEQSEILRIEGCGNYTNIFLKDGRKFLVSKTLKVIMAKLQIHYFIRIHQSHVVNALEIVFIGQSCLKMSDQTELPVSRSRKAALNELLGYLKY